VVSSSKIKLSVLIPVFRTDISLLVGKVAVQLQLSKIPFEIIVLDDSADARFYDWHADFKTSTQLRILTATTNKGRSGSRNFLMQQASGSHWLFLDGDMAIPSGFIQNYLAAIEQLPSSVIVGGIEYETSAKGLRNFVGTQREVHTATDRQQHPYRAFTAANVVLPAEKIAAIRFDESIVTYGHEDTIFGLALLDAGIEILHIDNPATHLGLDDDITYFEKIEISLTTLAELWLRHPLIQKYRHEVRILAYWHKIRRSGLTYLLNNQIVLPRLEAMAKRSLFWLDVYKLAFLDRQIKKKKSGL